jgi:hypothetical protein
MANHCATPRPRRAKSRAKSSRAAAVAWHAIVLVALAALWPCVAAAQSADRPDDGIKVGDGWVYDRMDDISGNPKGTFTSLVTEVSAQEIVTNVNFQGKNGRGIVVFDHDWNRTLDNKIVFKPNDGHGVRLPLAVGKEWRSEYTFSNAKNGVNMKATSLAKVVAQEPLTTPAGTFDTFKIDRQVKEFNVADPSRLVETQFLMWFAPQINHWVRRTVITKVDKRVRNTTTDELTEVLHKP